MPSNLKIVDDFLPNPESVREEITHLPFYDIRLHGDMNRQIHPRSTEENHGLLEKALGRKVEQDYNIFRLSYEGQFPDEVVHQDSGVSDLIGVLYLSRPEDCRGGTALWRHKASGREAYPKAHEIRRAGKSPAREYAKLHEDARNPDAWEQVALAEMKFNRIIFFEAARFHSRWPRSGFGSSPTDGRLIWVTLFRCPQ